MADRPILFSAPMVRAILREIERPGTGKTQTRRVITSARVFATPERPAWTLRGDDLARALQNADRFRHMGEDGWFWEADAFPWQAPSTRTGWLAHIGYAPGDRLYVREPHHRTNDHAESHLVGYDFAEGSIPRKGRHLIEGVGHVEFFHHSLGGWGGRTSRNYPAMHMPRWASRITLIVTDVRVQRLQEIITEDCLAEGIEANGAGLVLVAGSLPLTAKAAYRALWDGLNADRGYGWDANPWIVAYTFRPVLGNIDQVQQ